MKFLAILKDSLLEALDTKVFYVMVGLSLLLTAVAFTVTFTPRPPNQIMALMVLPLIVDDDTGTIDFEQLMRRSQDPNFRVYEVLGSAPKDGAPDGPDSIYTVLVVAHNNSEEAAKKLREDPKPAIDRLRDRFGTLIDPESKDRFEMLKAAEVRLAPEGAQFIPEKLNAKDVYFEVTTQPTPVTRRFWPHQLSLFFGAMPVSIIPEFPLGLQLFLLESQLVNNIGAWVTILVSVIITAFFIPNMLRKGTIDLLLTKPLNRVSLLLSKYLGGLVFIFLNTALAIGGVWLALSLRSGIWSPQFLWSIPLITFFFAILYAVSTLFAVLTRSPIASILITIAFWFAIFIIGFIHRTGEELKTVRERWEKENASRLEKEEPPPPDEKPEEAARRERERRMSEPPSLENFRGFFQTVAAIRFILPRTNDLNDLLNLAVQRDLLTANQIKAQKLDQSDLKWGESLIVSSAFIIVMLGLSCWWFATKDY